MLLLLLVLNCQVISTLLHEYIIFGRAASGAWSKCNTDFELTAHLCINHSVYANRLSILSINICSISIVVIHHSSTVESSEMVGCSQKWICVHSLNNCLRYC